MKNRTIRRILNYAKMTLLFMILGSIVVYFAGTPFITYVTAHGNMVIVKGAPAKLGTEDFNLSAPIVNANSTLDQSKMQTPELDTQYATIACERIALTAPVYYGDSDAVLQNGVGQYSGSALPGLGKPILIAGHDSTFFAPLEDMVLGDVVSITTNYGKLEYEVVGTKVAAATDRAAYDLAQDKEQLILYTCYPMGEVTGDRSDRYFVYCDRISEPLQTEE